MWSAVVAVSLVVSAEIRQALVLISASRAKLGLIVRMLRYLHNRAVVARGHHNLPWSYLVALHLRGRHQAPLFIGRNTVLVLQRLLML